MAISTYAFAGWMCDGTPSGTPASGTSQFGNNHSGCNRELT